MSAGSRRKTAPKNVTPVFRWARRFILFCLFAVAAWTGYVLMKSAPEDLPWTTLEMDRPIGLFTGRKIAGLTQDRGRCIALLERTGMKIEPMEPQLEGQCPVGDAVRIASGQEMLALSPAKVAPSCPVVAGLALWQWRVVAPAAHRHFGVPVVRIRHLGSYACRRIYGRAAGNWSEHASADAIDISAFVLADGREIRLLRDWPKTGPEGQFLREVRDGACDLFSTVLSPDYNRQHADHFHLDQAERGEFGMRSCH